MNFCTHTYDDITSLENLLGAWKEFRCGKKNKKDVQEFERNLMTHIINLHTRLKTKPYRHGSYQHFKISDPKPRDIHKATVQDRLVHHAIYRVLYSYFDTKFIHDSYSCRDNKGTHKAIERFTYFTRKVSKNYTNQCFILKCDIRKFFANIDHAILVTILEKHISDQDILNLLKEIILSFNTKDKVSVGLPLGNLTSQLLVNIYMNEFDHYVKHQLKERYYIRYADDFVFVSEDKLKLEQRILSIELFLKDHLKLEMHPDKVFIQTIHSGVDFLGWIHFPKHKVLRTSTRKRMFKRLIENEYKEESVNSYLGLLGHGNGYDLAQNILNNPEFLK